jgi:hypothetical protein
MRHIREFSEHKNYSEFDYIDSKLGFPYPEEMKTIRESDSLYIEKEIKNLKIFSYCSRPQILNFSIWRWPLYFYDGDNMRSQDFGTKDATTRNSKTLIFYCVTRDKFFKSSEHINSQFHVAIIVDSDGWYWVSIGLEGRNKYFKCDQEYGLIECLNTELLGWNFVYF